MSSAISNQVHLFRRAQITLWKVDEAPTIIFSEYLNFADIIFLKLAIELPKYTKINNHAINFINRKELAYEPIFCLEPVDLETLKTYIETNGAHHFIKPFKSFVNTLILFVRKSDGSFRL